MLYYTKVCSTSCIYILHEQCVFIKIIINTTQLLYVKMHQNELIDICPMINSIYSVVVLS